MENQTGENQDTLNSDEETSAPETEETAPAETTEESVDESEAKIKKAEELAKNYKIRAEKAEQELKKRGKPEAPKSETISAKDLYALSTAKVHPDDVSEVEEYAKYKGISISEALKTSVIKTLLSEKEEERKTAQATNVGTARRSTSKPSDDTLLSEASKGNLPDDPSILAQARMKAKLARLK